MPLKVANIYKWDILFIQLSSHEIKFPMFEYFICNSLAMLNYSENDK